MAKAKRRNIKSENIINTVKMCLILIIGVLFCLSRVLGERNLSIILGVGFIGTGVALVILSLINDKKLLSEGAIIGYALISAGILSLSVYYIGLILMVVPYLLIVLGCGVFFDAFLAKFVRNGGNYEMVLKIIFGVFAITLGILLLTIAEFAQYSGVVFGIALIIFAVYSIVTLALTANKKS